MFQIWKMTAGKREMIWRHEEKEMMWSRPPPTLLPPNPATAPWWAVDQWRKQENRRKSELQIWFISEWIQVKKYSCSCFTSLTSRYGIWRSIYMTENNDDTPIATIASALYARTLIVRNWQARLFKMKCQQRNFWFRLQALCVKFLRRYLLNYFNWDCCEGQWTKNLIHCEKFSVRPVKMLTTWPREKNMLTVLTTWPWTRRTRCRPTWSCCCSCCLWPSPTGTRTVTVVNASGAPAKNWPIAQTEVG